MSQERLGAGSAKAKRLGRILMAGAAAILLAVGWLSLEDLRANRAVKVVHSTIPNAVGTGEVEVLKRLARGERIDVGDLGKVAAFVEGRNDCSDFRLTTLLRASYSYGRTFSPEVEAKVRV